jgi:hypothetical protein
VSAELHLFLLWSKAREREAAILSDLGSRFTILDAVEVEWTRARFAENLTRFYGQALPPGSDKELHCGDGPFLLVVVADASPLYRTRKRPQGREIVNAATFDAKSRYREWTGGGHRVHATLSQHELARDLFLLLGAEPSRYDDPALWPGTTRTLRRDLLGAEGWESVEQLVHALEVALGCVVLDAGSARPLALLVDDLWWAEALARAEPQADGTLRVTVAGAPLELTLHEVGDGSLEREWQEALLADRVRGERGFFVPSPLDELHLLLERRARSGDLVDEATLAHAAERAGVDPGAYGDVDTARALRAAWLAGRSRDDHERREGSATRMAQEARRLFVSLRARRRARTR